MWKVLVLVSAIMVATGCGKGPYDDTEQKPAEVVSEGSMPAAAPALNITEADLRAPFYPGATVDAGTSMKVKTETEESVLVFMTSKDDIKKIKSFYEEKVAGLKMAELVVGKGDHYVGQVKMDGGTVAIQLQSMGDSVKITAGYGKQPK